MIDLRDSNGYSWFDAYRPDGDMRNNRVMITYNGATYFLSYDDPNTRAVQHLPEWNENGRNPFQLRGYFESEYEKVWLWFGEFSVDTKNYRGESFTIDWGDGSTSVVKFDFYATAKKRRDEPVVHKAIWVESGLGEGTRSDKSLTLYLEKD
jgi:hypothetical protein